jgi:hypothetical protein
MMDETSSNCLNIIQGWCLRKLYFVGLWGHGAKVVMWSTIPSEGGIENQVVPSSRKCDNISHRLVQNNHQVPIATSDILFKLGIVPPFIGF